MKKTIRLIEKDIRQDYNDYCKDKNLDPKNKKSKDSYLQDYSKWYARYNGLSTLKAAKERVAKELKEDDEKRFVGDLPNEFLKRDWEKLQKDPTINAKEHWSDVYYFEVLEYGKSLEEDNILGQETPDERAAKEDSKEKGLYSESVDDKISDLAREVQAFMQDFDTYDYNDNYSDDEEAYEDAIQSLAHPESRKQVIDKLNEIIQEDNTQEIKDKAQELLNKINDLKDEDFYNESVLTEDEDTGKDEENDSAEEIADELQDETGAEEEEESVALDEQLADLREVLPDLDLSLYQVTNKEDTNKIFYFIGKVAKDSDDVLMLVDANPMDKEENNVINEIPKDDTENVSEDGSDEFDIEEKFDFIKIPDSYDTLATMSPRYGDELNPNHEEVMEYLMGCLIKKNPERAEELSSEKDIDDGSKVPLDPDIQSDIDDKIEFYSSKLNK